MIISLKKGIYMVRLMFLYMLCCSYLAVNQGRPVHLMVCVMKLGVEKKGPMLGPCRGGSSSAKRIAQAQFTSALR